MNSNETNKQQDVENTNFDVKQIENDIDELLRISGISRDSVGTLAYEALRHQYMAASIFVKCGEAEQAVVGAEQKRLRNFFGVRCTLKSRKTRKSKRTSSPGPLSLEKENIMGSMSEGKLLFKMAMPMIFSVLVSSLYNIVDSIFVGRLGNIILCIIRLNV